MYKAIVPLLLLIVFQAAPAQDDPKPKGDKPSFGDKDDAVLQNIRYLKVRNETSGTINVFVQFRAPVEGAWTWIPADPIKSTDALSFEIEAGKEIDVQHKDAPVGASRMRIWATSETEKWLTYKTKDLWLVQEKNEEGEHVYMASGVETFSFVFSSDKDKGVIPGDADMPGQQNLPTEGPNVVPLPPEIPWDVLPDPLPPNFPLVRDLAVLPVYTSGSNATVRVKNLGHFSSNVGRRLMVQKVAPGSIPEDRGPIGPLFHFSVKTFYLLGMTPGNYIAFVSPGDDFPYSGNDKKPFTITAAAYPDAAVLPVIFIAGKAHIKVKNVGTAPLPAGRTLKTQKLPGGPVVDHGPVGALAVNDIRAYPGIMLAAGNYKAFITPGDAPPHQANDDRLFSVPVSTFFDFDVLPITVFAGKAHIKIKNIGTADAPGGRSLKTQKLPGGPIVDHGPVGPLAINALKIFPPIPLAAGDYRAFVTPGDAAPHHGNDSENFTIPVGPDLEVSLPTKAGAMVKATIHNNGPGAYPGMARTWQLEKLQMGSWVAIPTMGTHVIPGMGPAASISVQGTFTGAGTYRIRITAGDANAANDVRTKALP